jgi:AcrR family transcriptional regulator
LDLTTAMGINRPSLYAAFGNKEALFRQALDEPTARAVVEQLLRGVVELLTDPHHPRGCLMV